MPFLKYASADILEIKSSPTKHKTASLSKFSDWSDHEYRTEDDFLYVRVRAISSRINQNNDAWSSNTLKESWDTFRGRPAFVEHANQDPARARGVVVDVKLHVEDPKKIASSDPFYKDAHKDFLPPTWIELLIEVDAKTFPKLARAIISGEMDGVSMGANVEVSRCSHCGNEATDASNFCRHISSKGAYFDHTDESGRKTAKRSFEWCEKVSFFEISFVASPADETALFIPGTLKHAATKEADFASAPTWFAVGAATLASMAGIAIDDLYRQYVSRFGAKPSTGPHLTQALKQLVPGLRGEVDQMPAPTAPFDQNLSSKTAERNDPPQYTMETAPEKIDTLRQDRLCSVCGSDGMEEGKCEVCGFQEPPEGFDNPDLEKAQQVDQEMRQDRSEQGGDPTQVETPIADPNGTPPAAQPPAPTMASTNNSVTTTTSATLTDESASSKTVTAANGPSQGRINVNEIPILPAGRKPSDKPKNAELVEDHHRPVESSAEKGANTDMTDTQKTADGASAHGGSDTAPDKRVDVEGTGAVMDNPLQGVEHQNVDKEVKVEGEPTSTWSGMDGQTEAVSTDPFPASADGVKASVKEAGPAFPDHEPTTVDVRAPIAEEVGERTKTFDNPSKRTTDPVTSESFPAAEDSVKKAASDARKHTLASIRLAETEIALELTSADAKWDRVAELESSSLAELDAQMETLARVKTAGLRKQAARKTTATSLPSLQGQRLAANTPTEHAAPTDDQSLTDAQAFM